MVFLTFDYAISDDELGTLFADVDLNTPATIETQGDTVVQTLSNGLRVETKLTNRTPISATTATLEVYSPDGARVFTVPNLDMKINSAQVGNGTFIAEARVNDYFGAFDGIEFDFTAGDDRVDGDDLDSSGEGPAFVAGVVAGALGSFQVVANTALDSLARKDLLVDFGAGDDTLVFDTTRSNVSVTEAGGRKVIVTQQQEVRALNLERLDLRDGSFLFEELEGQYADYTYALYAASLGRTPDEAGFLFWNDVMNSGAFDGATRESTELRLAEEFVNSAEFAVVLDEVVINNGLFDPGTGEFLLTEEEIFITAMYDAVLMRQPDQAGFDFWLGLYENGELNRADTLRHFAISDENAAQIAADTDFGYWLA